MSNLSEGGHNVTVYQLSYVNGNPENEEIVGSVDTQFNIAISPEPEPSSTTLAVAATGASVAVIGAGLLVYFRKHNREIPKTREVKEV